MGILSRFADIVFSNINDLLDKAENPEKMAKQYLRQAVEDLAEVKEQTASVMADEKQCKCRFDEAKAAVDKYMVLAQKSVAAGNDNDARVFLTEKNKRAAELATAETAYKAAQANADKMRQLYNKLSSDVAPLQSRLKNIQAMSAVADAQKTVNKMTSKDYGGGLAKFDAMEERVRQQLDESSAVMELAEQSANAADDAADDLAAKYGDTAGDVESELAAMKADMGFGNTGSVEDELAAMKAEQQNT